MQEFKNELNISQSPYLLQHKNNPVAWKVWGEEAFREAKKRNIPVLVSIGYSTCHWCHVMAHEVFENHEAASVMNNSFVCIKVDREEHPEVDEIYMEACQAMNGTGGWPLNIITDHSGKPFFAATYVPLEQWKNLAQQISSAWDKNRDEINEFAEQLSATLAEIKITSTNSVDIQTIRQKLFEYLSEHFDYVNPDFAGKDRAPRFPSHTLYYYLLSKRNLEKTISSKLEKALETIQDSGLHDIVGGGFHRYSTDKEWRVPHFEKMLYDNAQMITNFALAAGRFNRPDFLKTAERTADYLIRELSVYENGKFKGFASAEDADDPMGEGSYYAWTPQTLKDVLGETIGERIAREWNITDDPTNIHGVFPFRIPQPKSAKDFAQLTHNDKLKKRIEWESVCEKLLTSRNQRPKPFRDSKVLSDWNALALIGFSILFAQSQKDRYKQIAFQLASIIKDRVSTDLVERIPGKSGHITDYGHSALAMQTAWEVFGNQSYLETSQNILSLAQKKFTTNEGHLYTSEKKSQVFMRFEEKYDHAQPAGAHSLLITWIRLFHSGFLTNNNDLLKKALLHRFNLIAEYPVMSPSLLCAMEEWQLGPVTLTIPSSMKDQYPELLKWASTDLRLSFSDESNTIQLCEKDRCTLPAKTIEELNKGLSFTW